MYSFSVANQVSTLSHLEKRETCWWWCCYSSTCEKNRRKGKKKEKKNTSYEKTKKKSQKRVSLWHIFWIELIWTECCWCKVYNKQKFEQDSYHESRGSSLSCRHTHKKNNRVSLHSCNLLVQPSLMSLLVSCTKCDLPNSPGSPLGPGGPTSPEGPGGP